MITLFLGGTCNNSLWRDELVKLLDDDVDAFNPVVPDWTEECMARELVARRKSDIILYVITPKMTGVYSIAEAVEDSIKRPRKTLFAYLATDGETSFTEAQLKSLKQVAKMIDTNGGITFTDLNSVAAFINIIAASRRR